MNKKGFTAYFIVLIVAIAGVMGYLALAKKQEPVMQQINAISSTKTYITPNNIAKESGKIFKFQYPVGFTVIEGDYKTPGGSRFPDISISKDGGAGIDVVRIPGGISTGPEITCENYATVAYKCVELKSHVVMTSSKDQSVLNAFDLITKTLEIERF
ncbi:MAG: hypothetical protein KGJ58_00245 [Patescibacteria group bacterium]|nr:hypothetical protein [Patescibacteria group bacterium]MDE1988789.1 hypothetical protein [Patescibacteria group bacterium]MDE2217874.1 hypothetical protein [Patescibacteria group bacterium]